MPDETSYPDRIGRAGELQAAIAGFTPIFVPQDSNLAPDAFLSTIGSIEEANDNVSDAEAILNPLVQDRLTATDELKAKALRVKDFVTSVITWKKSHTTVSRAADKVRGYRPPKKPPVTPPGGTTPPPKPPGSGSRSQQGYRDIERLFKKLIEAVEKVTGYTAPALSALLLGRIRKQEALPPREERRPLRAEPSRFGFCLNF